MKTNRQLPDSKHFRLQQLADGVYAAIHIDGGAAIRITIHNTEESFSLTARIVLSSAVMQEE